MGRGERGGVERQRKTMTGTERKGGETQGEEKRDKEITREAER